MVAFYYSQCESRTQLHFVASLSVSVLAVAVCFSKALEILVLSLYQPICEPELC